MNDLDLSFAIKNLHDILYNSDLVKTYFKLKDDINNDEYILSLVKNIKFFAHKNDHINLEKYKEMYENHPLINNYNVVEQEIRKMLLEIKEEIEAP